MGNCLWLWCLDNKIKYKNNGNRYTEYRLTNNKKVDDVFKIMVKIYPNYKITSVDDSILEENEKLDMKTKIVNIYFNDKTQNTTRIEVFD